MSGCDSAEKSRELGSGSPPAPGDLVWERKPRLIVPETLPRDRILSGKVRNDSLRAVELTSKELSLVDAAGGRVPASAIFLETYVHGLYPPARQPERLPESELRRTGRKAVIHPGKSVPLTVSWRQRADTDPPVRLEFGTGALPVPRS